MNDSKLVDFIGVVKKDQMLKVRYGQQDSFYDAVRRFRKEGEPDIVMLPRSMNRVDAYLHYLENYADTPEKRELFTKGLIKMRHRMKHTIWVLTSDKAHSVIAVFREKPSSYQLKKLGIEFTGTLLAKHMCVDKGVEYKLHAQPLLQQTVRNQKVDDFNLVAQDF